MVADFDIMLDTAGANAAPGTLTNTDVLGPPNIRFKNADNPTIDTIDPIPIPGAGTNYSRWKQIYLKCITAPATQVDNVKFYTDGTGFGTGIAVRVGNQFPTKNSGSSAGYEVADVANEELVAGHGGITTDADAFSKTSAAPLAGPTISEAGSIINAIDETTNYLVLQMNVINTAVAGNLADETYTIQYDEI